MVTLLLNKLYNYLFQIKTKDQAKKEKRKSCTATNESPVAKSIDNVCCVKYNRYMKSTQNNSV